MDPYILTKKDEYRSILYISVPLLIAFTICLIYLIYRNSDFKAILGCTILYVFLLYSVIDYISFIRKNKNYETLNINDNGIQINKGKINRTIRWNEIRKVTLGLGKSRLEGLVMSISTKSRETIEFSFFQYSIGLRSNRIIQSIMYFSGNPKILETNGIYGWIRSLMHGAEKCSNSNPE